MFKPQVAKSERALVSTSLNVSCDLLVVKIRLAKGQLLIDYIYIKRIIMHMLSNLGKGVAKICVGTYAAYENMYEQECIPVGCVPPAY